MLCSAKLFSSGMFILLCLIRLSAFLKKKSTVLLVYFVIVSLLKFIVNADNTVFLKLTYPWYCSRNCQATSDTTVVNTDFCDQCLLLDTSIFKVPQKVAETLETLGESTVMTQISSEEKAEDRNVWWISK